MTSQIPAAIVRAFAASRLQVDGFAAYGDGWQVWYTGDQYADIAQQRDFKRLARAGWHVALEGWEDDRTFLVLRECR